MQNTAEVLNRYFFAIVTDYFINTLPHRPLFWSFWNVFERYLEREKYTLRIRSIRIMFKKWDYILPYHAGNLPACTTPHAHSSLPSSCIPRCHSSSDRLCPECDRPGDRRAGIISRNVSRSFSISHTLSAGQVLQDYAEWRDGGSKFELDSMYVDWATA